MLGEEKQLAFARTIEDVRHFKGEKSIHFICLSIISYQYCKSNNLKCSFPHRFEDLHKTNYIKSGQFLAQQWIKTVSTNVTLNSREQKYLTSRFTTFFSMLVFDNELANYVINKFNPKTVHLFKNDYLSIARGEWDPETGFYFFNQIIKGKCKTSQIHFDIYSSDKTIATRKKRKHYIKKITSSISRQISEYLESTKSPRVGKSKPSSLIYLVGLRGGEKLKKDLALRFQKRNYRVTWGDFGSSLIPRVLNTIKKHPFYNRMTRWLKSAKFAKNHSLINQQNLARICSDEQLNKKWKIFDTSWKAEFDSMLEVLDEYLASQKKYLLHLTKQKPSLAICHGNESFVIACQKVGIPTVSLPHGAIMTPEICPMLGDYNCFPGEIQMKYHRSAGMTENQPLLFGAPHFPMINLNQEEENQPISTITFMAKNMGMRRWEFDDYDQYLELCKFLGSYSNKKGLKLIIKLHPSGGKHLYEFYKSLGFFQYDNIEIYLNEEFECVLEESDMFIVAQESSVICQILKSRKPVIFPYFHFSKPYMDNVMMQFLASNLLSSSSLEECKKQISQLVFDRKFKKDVLRQQESVISDLITDFGSETNEKLASFCAANSIVGNRL